MREILFRSDNLEVRRIAAGDGRHQVITFDPYHDEPGFDRAGFGEIHLAERGITAVHVLTFGNDWYQYRDLPVALQIARAAMAQADRRLAYGSSMGGYAAIRFAAAVGADVVLALSPQFSIDPQKVGFEERWRADQRRITFAVGLEAPIRSPGRIIVAYDPTIEADRLHVDRIAGEVAIERLALPHAGHPVGPFLAETGVLSELLAGALEEGVDLGSVGREARFRRGQSATWLGHFALAQPAHRPRALLSLAERAVELSPLDPAALDRLGWARARACDFAGAIEAHRRALDRERRPNYLWSYGKTLETAGDTAGALEIARELQALAPEVAGYHRWAADLNLELGERRAALIDLRAASSADSSHRAYRWAAFRLACALRLGRLLGR